MYDKKGQTDKLTNSDKTGNEKMTFEQLRERVVLLQDKYDMLARRIPNIVDGSGDVVEWSNIRTQAIGATTVNFKVTTSGGAIFSDTGNNQVVISGGAVNVLPATSDGEVGSDTDAEIGFYDSDGNRVPLLRFGAETATAGLYFRKNTTLQKFSFEGNDSTDET